MGGKKSGRAPVVSLCLFEKSVILRIVTSQLERNGKRVITMMEEGYPISNVHIFCSGVKRAPPTRMSQSRDRRHLLSHIIAVVTSGYLSSCFTVSWIRLSVEDSLSIWSIPQHTR